MLSFWSLLEGSSNNVSVDTLMKTPQFWVMGSMFFFIGCGGMGLFSVAKPMMTEVFSGFVSLPCPGPLFDPAAAALGHPWEAALLGRPRLRCARVGAGLNLVRKLCAEGLAGPGGSKLGPLAEGA